MPARVIVPSCVPRAVHSWTTRSSRMYGRRSRSEVREDGEDPSDRAADLLAADVDVAGDVVLEDRVLGVHGDDRVDVVVVPGGVVAVDELLQLVPVHAASLEAMTLVDWLAVGIVAGRRHLAEPRRGSSGAGSRSVGLAARRGARRAARAAPARAAARARRTRRRSRCGAVALAVVLRGARSCGSARPCAGASGRFLREARLGRGRRSPARSIGLVVAWVLGVVALQLPGQTPLRASRAALATCSSG